MICTLCLKEIKETEETIEVNGKIRHMFCSIELERMVEELEKIYQETCDQDI